MHPNPPPGFKNLLLDGILVGQIPSTGDLEKDTEAATAYLKSKGLYKEMLLPKAMFNQAMAFFSSAIDIYNANLTKNPINPSGVAPFVVNAAFSLEIFLKTLSQIHGNVQKGHELLNLYDVLPATAIDPIQQAKADVEREAVRRWPEFDDFRTDVIQPMDKAFVEWRYGYEIGSNKNCSH